MQIHKELEQGSPEWFKVRMGICTASMFSTVLASGRGGGVSKTRQKYLYQLAGEIITGTQAESYTNGHMARGHVQEIEARDLYCLVNEVEVEQVGFITGIPSVGCSPDGLVGEPGLLECKSRLPHLQIELLMADRVPPEHLHQCQGGLWVTEREWIDFVAYSPSLPLFQKRLYRDAKIISEIRMGVDRFLAELHEIVEKIKSL
jgi:hypothetical protein